jgi:hypothetical protein
MTDNWNRLLSFNDSEQSIVYLIAIGLLWIVVPIEVEWEIDADGRPITPGGLTPPPPPPPGKPGIIDGKIDPIIGITAGIIISALQSIKEFIEWMLWRWIIRKNYKSISNKIKFKHSSFNILLTNRQTSINI